MNNPNSICMTHPHKIALSRDRNKNMNFRTTTCLNSQMPPRNVIHVSERRFYMAFYYKSLHQNNIDSMTPVTSFVPVVTESLLSFLSSFVTKDVIFD